MNHDHPPKVFQVLAGPGGNWGGASEVVLAITEELIQRGAEVWVLCLSDYTVQRYEAVGAKAVTSTFWRRSIHPFWDLLALWELVRLCRREHFAVVNTHTSKGGMLGRLAARLAGVPRVIHTAHGYVFNEVESKTAARIYTYLEKMAAHLCDLVISVNEEERQIAIDKGVVTANKIVTIPNGIDIHRFKTVDGIDDVRRELAPDGEAQLIGATGRLMPQKGLTHFINALPNVLEHHPNVLAVFAGNGPLEAELKAQATALGVIDHCRFLGFRSDIPQILAALDLFVLPSLWEGMSISLLEAMAAGKAIVATNIKGNREVIHPEVNGLLIPPGDAEAMATAINRLLDQRQFAADLGRAAQESAIRHFSQDTMISRTLAYYFPKPPQAVVQPQQRSLSRGRI